MNTITLRTATAAALIAPALTLGAGVAGATAHEPPTAPPAVTETTPVSPDMITPVVLLPGQTTWQGALGTVLACAPWGLIPLIGPNVAFPICLA
ncbi:hypothetical protein [Rhodococcus maanshanensis]|uniref:Uncharacterized protein n=1 Tax=Rhodococcus maanshanensis TaxID=183556 RepID=A0A1H7U7D2_9NOCA|nr:hypothetical protein [Rhodococcus maanshanensis]SEL92207.1 hypothetical protein SAMN05444583_11767 [Rhodococcus maanshanensis]